ncbi:WD repeat-containing protein, partial [Plakobranchus ocellatus]
MARRVLESEMMVNLGIPQEPLQGAKKVSVLKEIKMHKSFGGTFSMQFNFDGSQLAMGFGAGGIQVFSGATGEMSRELRACRQGGSSIMCLKWHPKEPHILYAADTEGYIYVYNTDTGELMSTIAEAGNEINTMDFCVDGYNFATGGRDLNIRVYETKNNSLVKTFEGFSEKTVVTEKSKVGNTMRVFSIKFHPNNQYVFISGGWDNHIKIWDIRDNHGIKRNIWGPHLCGDALDMK